MIDRSPEYSLEIIRPVLNIGPEAAEGLRATFPEPTDAKEKRDMDNVLRPLHVPKAELIVASEFKRLLRHVGLHAVSEGHIEELAEHMESVLGTASQSLASLTLPQQTRQVGKEGKLLSVATSRYLIGERRLAKRTLTEYYETGNTRDRLWQHDASTASVLVARTFKAGDNWMINHLDDVLGEKPELLPSGTEFGPITVRPVLPKGS